MTEQANSNKQVILVVMSLVFLTITYFVFSKYVFKSDMSSLNIGFIDREDTEASVVKIKDKTKDIKLIDSKIFESDKFDDLEESLFKGIDLSEYKKGKINPFEAKIEEKKNTNNDIDETDAGTITAVEYDDDEDATEVDN